MCASAEGASGKTTSFLDLDLRENTKISPSLSLLGRKLGVSSTLQWTYAHENKTPRKSSARRKHFFGVPRAQKHTKQCEHQRRERENSIFRDMQRRNLEILAREMCKFFIVKVDFEAKIFKPLILTLNLERVQMSKYVLISRKNQRENFQTSYFDAQL